MFSGFISPICLPTNLPSQLQIVNENFEGKNAVAAGWGLSKQSKFFLLHKLIKISELYFNVIVIE